MAARRWIVRGQVQGVGFRWFVWRLAERLKLRGFARNLADGSVEVVAAGTDDGLAELERALGQGPAAARVANVEKFDVPHEHHLPNTFDIN
ncbi:MAG: acylphosphatase [Gemmatimonadales bacterium]